PMLSGSVYYDPSRNRLCAQPNGRILIAGSFSAVNGVSRNGIARLNNDGSLDFSFDPGTGIGADGFGLLNVRSLTLQRDGKALIGGVFSSVNGVARASVARLFANS